MVQSFPTSQVNIAHQTPLSSLVNH